MPDVLEQPIVTPSSGEWAVRSTTLGDPAFLVAAAVYLASIFAMLVASWRLAGHHFVYPLDDVYINMAVAKNFAQNGVWGVTRFEFASCTSSPLYILILSAVYRVFGVNSYAPLVLSGLFGLGAIYIASKMLQAMVPGLWRLVALLAFVLFTPLFALGSLGMEHSLHLLLVLLFLRALQDETVSLGMIGCLTALMCGVRYEGVLMAGSGTLLLLVRRQWIRAAVVAGSAWIPVGIYALFSLRHGGFWLPNSVALKGVQMTGAGVEAQLVGIAKTAGRNCLQAPHLPFLLATLILLAVALWGLRPKLAGLLAVGAGAGVLHLMTASVGWVFRYESYLIGAGVVVVAASWQSAWQLRRHAAGAACSLLMLTGIILAFRGCLAAGLLPQYSKSIYLQQWQTARFLESYYPHATVAANDIGAITYVNDLNCFDMAGLANAAVFRAKRRGEYTTSFLQDESAARKVQVAVVYDAWFSKQGAAILGGGPPLPATWVRVRRWTVPVRNQLGDRTVSFYAMNLEGAGMLKGQLLAFEPTLPKEISVSD